MHSYRFFFSVLFIIAVLSGCASADKRFGQGQEQEMRGQYENAVQRYVQALEKDPGYTEARVRLAEVGDLAINEQIAAADDWMARGNPVNAAAHFRRADTVVDRARSVGVRLGLPLDYTSHRRAVFDHAFDALVARGDRAREQGRWQDGIAAYRRARNEFEPTLTQRNQALAEESILFVQWSESEYAQGHLRKAFDVAANVQQLEWSPAAQAARAAGFMEDCLNEGEVELIVLPVQTRPGSARATAKIRAVADHVEKTLQDGPWRQPPAFVQLHEPLTVRDLLSDAGILDGEYRPGTMALILRLAEADYAAYVQLLSADETEFDVRSRTETVKTRSGGSTTFVREDGKRRIQAEARVVIADGYGNEITDVVVSGSGTAPFARGVYGGDPGQLNLGARQVDLFDQFTLRSQKTAAHEALAHDLAAVIAGAVFQPTLAQIP